MSVNRREFLALSSGAVVALRFRDVYAGQSAQPPATRFETIRRNVGYFTGRGGTIGWLVNPNAVVVIDAQYPDTARICLTGVEEKSSRGIDLLFNTHHHADHTAGNPVFKPRTKRIVAQARVPGLQKTAPPPAPSATTPEAAPVVADTTFDSTWSESLGDERVSATHYGPAHTGGDSVIRFEQANVAHMGDLLFHEMHPFVDRPGGASIQNWMKILETVTKELPADTIYIAGHARQGAPVALDRQALQRQRDYFDAVLAHVRKGIAGGRSKEEIATLEELPGFPGLFAAPPRLTLANVLGVAFDELTAKP
jgi:glyoxylase-like metal-dependent hydrolase (beta-lactamase superfamily II)